MKRSIFIGTEAAQGLASRVLKHSIEAHASKAVEVKYLDRALAGAGVVLDNSVSSNTPFSKQRLFVPALAAEGQAAYLDSDMIVFDDIHRLFDAAAGHPIASCAVRQSGRDAQTSVTVFDVKKCTWDPVAIVGEIDRDCSKYRPYVYEFSFAGGTRHVLPAAWNDLEDYDPSSSCLVHFTDMDTQPWVTATNPIGDLWLRALRTTLAANPEVTQEMERSIDRFEVRPSLKWQVHSGWQPSARIPLKERLKDVFLYIPPHTLVHGLPLGRGRKVFSLLQGGAPKFAKRALALLCCLALLARRKRRLLVAATLLNKRCTINRSIQTMFSLPNGSSSLP